MRLICTLLDVPYLGFSAFHYIRVGQQRYDIFSTHGASGARLPYTKIKSALDLYRWVSAEMVLMGHVHSLDHMTAEFHEISRKDKHVVTRTRHAVLTGHFLEYRAVDVESYAAQKLMMPSKTGVAQIKFRIDEHKITVSL